MSENIFTSIKNIKKYNKNNQSWIINISLPICYLILIEVLKI